jgi:hypothetical protein
MIYIQISLNDFERVGLRRSLGAAAWQTKRRGRQRRPALKDLTAIGGSALTQG